MEGETGKRLPAQPALQKYETAEEELPLASNEKPDALCSHCKELPWLELFTCPKNPEFSGFDFWSRPYTDDNKIVQTKSVAEMRNTIHCNACQVLLQIFRNSREEIAVVNEESTVVVLWPVLQLYDSQWYSSFNDAINSKEFDPSTIASSVLITFYGVSKEIGLQKSPIWIPGDVYDPQEMNPNNDFRENPQALAWNLVAGPEHEFSREQHGCYRPKGTDTLDLDSLAKWIKACDTRHEHCNPSMPDVVSAVGLRCIDVDSKKIVRIQPLERYIALSYVWGNRSHPNNVLQPDGSLQIEEVPYTIRDAIDIVKGLGENYLWVDSVCIDKSKPGLLQEKIRQMDLIYGGAYLTLVSLHGADINAGIPGVRPNTRDPVHLPISIGGGQTIYVTRELDVMKAIRNSVWSTHGWTYQEGLLSSRCLYFGNHRAFFVCPWGVGEELYHVSKDASCMPGDFYLAPREGEVYGTIPTSPDSGIWNMQVYAPIVEYYMERNLTFASDRIDAFRGRLQRWGRSKGAEFTFGLPIQYLSRAIQWWPQKHCGARHRLFPSWSWADCASKIMYTDALIDWNFYKTKCIKVAQVNLRREGELIIRTESRAFEICCEDQRSDGGLNLNTSYRITLEQEPIESRVSHLKLFFQLELSMSRTCAPSNPAAFTLEEAWGDATTLTDFILLSHWQCKGFGDHGDVDFVVAMLIRRLDSGKAERAGITLMNREDWLRAPFIDEDEEIILV